MHHRGTHILLVTGEEIGRTERSHDLAQPHHRMAVRDKVIGIGLAITGLVGAGGILRVGPHVVGFGEEIMRSASTAGARLRGDRHRRFDAVKGRLAEDAWPLESHHLGQQRLVRGIACRQGGW